MGGDEAATATASASASATTSAEQRLGAILAASGRRTLGVLFVINLVDEFDRAAFNILAPDIQDSLGLSDRAVGLTGTIGGLIVLVGIVPIGILADRMRRTRLLAICTLATAAGGAAAGAVGSQLQLLLTRAIGGFGKAGEAPVQKAILADAYPADGRARIFGVHQAANPISRVLAPLLVAAVVAIVGGGAPWRWVFVVLAVPGLLAGLSALHLREPPRGQNERRAVLGDIEVPLAPRVPVGAAVRRLRKIATFNAFLSALGVLGLVTVGIPTYVNLALRRDLGLSTSSRSFVHAFTALGGIAGLAIGGRYGDRLFRRAPRQVLLLVAGAVAAHGLLLPLSLYMPNAAAYAAVDIVSGAVIATAMVPALSLLTSVTPYRLRSIALAAIGLCVAVIGGLGGVLIVGTLSNRLGPRTALTIALPPISLVGAALLARGARWVDGDIAAVAREIDDEHAAASHPTGPAPLLEIRGLDVSYGPGAGALRRRPRRCARARRWPCSAPTAPASPRCSGSISGLVPPRPRRRPARRPHRSPSPTPPSG